MGNPHRGEVALGTHTLCMSINAICELEEEIGAGINQIAADLASPETMRMSALRDVVWAALREHHPGMTKEEAGRIMAEVGVAETSARLGEAFEAAFSSEQGGSDNKARPRKAKSSVR